MSFDARVQGLPANVSEEAVRDFFSRIGPVEKVELEADSGAAVVSFDNAEDLEEALHVNGREFEAGVPITVTRAKEPTNAAEDAAPEEKGDDAEDAEAPGSGKTAGDDDPLMKKSVAIRRIPVGTVESDLRAFFEPCGEIVDLFINHRRHFAFIAFSEVEGATAALAKDGAELNGKPIGVEMKQAVRQPRAAPKEERRAPREAPARPPRLREGARVVVKGLPSQSSEGEVRAALQEFGEVVDLFVNTEKRFAFAAFATERAAEAASSKSGRVKVGGKNVDIEARVRPRCFRCNKDGHIAAQCPSQTILCRVCGRPGHLARECPSRGGDGGGRGGRGGRDDRDSRRRERDDSVDDDRDRRRRRRSSTPPRRRRYSRSRSPRSRSRSPRRGARRYSRSRSRSPRSRSRSPRRY